MEDCVLSVIVELLGSLQMFWLVVVVISCIFGGLGKAYQFVSINSVVMIVVSIFICLCCQRGIILVLLWVV